MSRSLVALVALLVALLPGGMQVSPAEEAAPLDFSKLPPNTWVKLSPLDKTPPSPRLGYEGACVWDSKHQRVIRYGGHNQGGGGEQNSEMWSFDPRTAVWKLHEPNVQPVGICCGQQNIYDPVSGRYIRFPAFSASHGWQWLREVWLNDSSVWTYDLDANLWRNMRPLPTAHPRPLRCASYDSEHQVIVMFGGEGSSEGTWVYDPQQNTWTKMDPKPEPANRSGGNMAYDKVNKVHVLFGSQFDNDQHTWVYDLRKNEWRNMSPLQSAEAPLPPTDKNDAVLTYFEPTGEILAIIKQTEGKDDDAKHSLQTWAYSVGQNRWRKINPEREPDPTSNRARQLMYAPELGVALLENRPSNSKGPAEQQIWALKLGPSEASAARPTPPRNVRLTGNEILSWDAPAGPQPRGYVVYRAAGDLPWKLQFSKVAQTGGTSYSNQRSIKPEYFRVTALDAAGRESEPSVYVADRPRVIEDVVVSVRSPDVVKISWRPHGESEGLRYHVERAVVEVLSDDQLKRLKTQTPPLESPSVGMIKAVGPFARITRDSIIKCEFTDVGITLTKPQVIAGDALDQRKVAGEDLDADGRAYRFAVYAYRVRAIDSDGLESGPSPAVFTIPSPPQQLFSREEGTTCHLRWQANPEEGLQGYRVYRMDGRFAKDAIPRLTADPIKEMALSDPGAGKNTRRYYVVAVDALGQEGFPTSPVWFDREWKPFYKPFTGEWHQ